MTSTKWPFTKFHHVHVVVREMERAEALLSSIGISLADYQHPGKYKLIEGYDPETLATIHYKYASIGDVHLQFMSPKDNRPSRHRSFLDTRGNGVYSVGFVVDDVDAAEAELIRRGLKVHMRGRHEDGWGYTYFDTAEILGVNLTVRQNPYTERKK